MTKKKEQEALLQAYAKLDRRQRTFILKLARAIRRPKPSDPDYIPPPKVLGGAA